MTRAYVVGVGMTNFEKPGRRDDFDYPEMALEAATAAFQDAGVQYRDVGAAMVGYVYGESTCGQRALYQMGMTGIPIVNVNNNCATGSSALYLAHELVAGGRQQCVLALGFEKMERGSLGSKWDDRTNPMDHHMQRMAQQWGFEAAPPACQLFGNAGREHMRKYGSRAEHFAKIAMKNHAHSVNNPRSQFKDTYTLQQIQQSTNIHDPLTKLQCCPTSDGSAAAIIASEEFVVARGLQERAVLIAGISLCTDLPSTLHGGDAITLVGYDMSRKAAREVYAQARIAPDEIDVIELHDCFSANELITYEALGLCPEGKAHELVDRGDNTYGGKFVVNPSGGLISKGHPLGATGIAQCVELCLQLRGKAGARQVPDAKLALQHNIGLGGACVVAAYRLGFPSFSDTVMKSPPLRGGSAFKCSRVFAEIEKQLSADGASLVKKVKAIYKFKVSAGDGGGGSPGVWLVDVKNGSGSVKFMQDGKADCTLSAKDSDLFDIMTGSLDPMKAYMSGKLKLSGNIMLAQKLRDFQAKAAEVFSMQPQSMSKFRSDSKFSEMSAALKADPNMWKKLSSSVKFVISRNGKERKIWFVDCRRSPGEVIEGRDDKADCTIEVSDDDWACISEGKLNPQKAFFEKKLTITGNMMIATKLALFQSQQKAKL